MGKYERLYQKIIEGKSDSNIPFEKTRDLLVHLGFRERIRGSHHIYTMSGLKARINLQPKGTRLKGYQTQQIRRLFIKHSIKPD